MLFLLGNMKSNARPKGGREEAEKKTDLMLVASCIVLQSQTMPAAHEGEENSLQESQIISTLSPASNDKV